MTLEEKQLLEDTNKKLEEYSNKLDEFLNIYYRKELPDYTLMKKDLVMWDTDIVLRSSPDQTGSYRGTKIGTKSTDKIGFFGATPVQRQSTVTTPTGSGIAGVDSAARSSIVEIKNILTNLGLTA